MMRWIDSLRNSTPTSINRRLYFQAAIIAAFLGVMILIQIWTGNTLSMITAIARFERTHTVSRLQAKASLLEFLRGRNTQSKESFFENMNVTQSYNKVFSELLAMRTSVPENEFAQIIERTFKEADHSTALILVNRVKVLYWHPIVIQLVGHARNAHTVGEKILSLASLALEAKNEEEQHAILLKINQAEEEFVVYERSFSRQCSDLAKNILFFANFISIFVLVLSTGFSGMMTYRIGASLLQQAVEHADELKKSQERLHLVIKGANDAPWDWDLVTNELYYSPQWWAQIGYAPDELPNDAALWQRLTHPDDAERVNAALQKALNDTSEAYEVEFRLRHKAGHYVSVLSRGFISRDPNGKPIRVSGANMDLSERKKTERALQQAQKMESIGTLAGGIAHDFNNLLAVITGNVSYARSLSDQNPEINAVLSEIQIGASQAQNLTLQLLTFAKGGEPLKELQNVNKLLQQSARFVTSGSKSKCEFILASDLWAAEVDPGQFNQVISNIVINADQAMPNGGTVTIRTENARIEAENNLHLREGIYIKVSLEDQGGGIPENLLQKIFDPYFTTKSKGSGLGLATAYSIVKRHGGTITVYSEAGKGSVFHIYLPASLREVRSDSPKAQSRHQGRGRILIMDDQEQMLKVAEIMLKKMGYQTQTATEGAKAIEIFREAFEAGQPFDLVILDLTVPGGKGGAETMPELLKIDPKIRAIVSSGYSNDPIMANYQDYGFCGIIPKPYTLNQLSEILDRLFGSSASSS